MACPRSTLNATPHQISQSKSGKLLKEGLASQPAKVSIDPPFYYFCFTIYYLPKFAPVAQLDRAFDYESKGRTFESCRVHQQNQLFTATNLGGCFSFVNATVTRGQTGVFNRRPQRLVSSVSVSSQHYLSCARHPFVYGWADFQSSIPVKT